MARTDNNDRQNVPPESVALQVYSVCTPSARPPAVRHTRAPVEREMPKDHFIWSLCCFLYSPFCCLGLAALVHSIKARDRKVAGDVEAARSHGSTAHTLNIISTVIFCLFVLISVIVVSFILSHAGNAVQSMTSYGRSHFDDYFRTGGF